MCNMLPLTKLFELSECQQCCRYGQQPLDSVADACLVLHIALETTHNERMSVAVVDEQLLYFDYERE